MIFLPRKKQQLVSFEDLTEEELAELETIEKEEEDNDENTTSSE